VQTKTAIEELLAGGAETPDDPRSALLRLAVQYIVEEALEAKTREPLGREYYEHGAGDEGESDSARGHRNGYRRGRLASAEGEIGFASPQVRGIDAGSLKALRERLAGRTEGLEELAVEMFARGCSTRDIEAMFQAEDGTALLSKSAAAELTERLWEEYEAFATRDLSAIKPLYLFIDGVAERLTPGFKREAVLCAWAITWDGRKVLLHLAPGRKESTECCKDFIEDMQRRGLDAPVLVATDGAAGLIRAVEECFPTALRQRCLAHKMRNLGAKLPEDLRAEFEAAAKASYQAPSPAMARALREDLVARFERQAPTAVRCFEEDFDACIAQLQVPVSHRRVVRTTNLLERLFGETRRRSKVAPSVSGERPVLKMLYAAAIRASDSWRGIRIGELERRQLERLQAQLTEKAKQEHAPAVNSPSTPQRIYSTDGT
jgi:transposase-like protein